MSFRIDMGSLFAAVVGLIDIICPAAVFGRIAKTVIDAIKRVSALRSFAHIGNEVGKISPSFADSDSSAAVMLKGYVVRIFAALMHSYPNHIFWRITFSMPKRPSSSSKKLAILAAAANIFPIFQVLRHYKLGSAATANTVPAGKLPLIWATGNDGQSSVGFAGEITKGRLAENERVAISLPAVVMHSTHSAQAGFAFASCN